MSEYILGLDIGSTKIRAIIAKNDGIFTVLGVGGADTLGIKKGFRLDQTSCKSGG